MDSLRARAWEARAALAAAVAAVVVLAVFGNGRGLWLVGLTVAAAVIVVAAGFLALQQRGWLRWLAVAVAVAAPVALLGVFVAERPPWVALVAVVLLGAAVLAARTALRPDASSWALPVVDVAPPQRPFLVMNPRSGGGKVARFGLQQQAEALGAEVALLDRPDTSTSSSSPGARSPGGADLLGVAGGDGTQALVAQVAAEHDVPFLVISAGTRNHFALDLGLDRADPTRCLDALRDGVELRIDLGVINGRCSSTTRRSAPTRRSCESPAYRDDKRGTALEVLPDLLRGTARRRTSSAHADGAGRRRAAGATGEQQPLRGHRPRRAGPPGPARPRRARGRRRPGRHRAAGGRAAARRAPSRPARSGADEVVVDADDATRPGRHRRGVAAPAHPGALPVRARCAAGAGAPRPPRRAAAKGRLDWSMLWGLALGRSLGRRGRAGPGTAGPGGGPPRPRAAASPDARRGGGRPGPVRWSAAPARRRGRPRPRSGTGG